MLTKSRLLKKRNGARLVFDYAYNKKSSIITEIFFECLKYLDAFISRKPEGNILMLIDNFMITYLQIYCLSCLALKLRFYPSNITSLLQSTDADIIANLKLPYRIMQYNRVLAAMAGENNIYKIDQLPATVKWSQSGRNYHRRPFTTAVRRVGCFSLWGVRIVMEMLWWHRLQLFLELF